MLKSNEPAKVNKKPQVSVSRFFDAPPDLVFRMWTTPEYLQQWWGPKKNHNTECKVDARPGGAMKITMHLEGGIVRELKAVFNEIDEPHKIVFTTLNEAVTGSGRLEVRHTVTFNAEKKGTRLFLIVEVLERAPEFADWCEGIEPGWEQSLDRLSGELSNKNTNNECAL